MGKPGCGFPFWSSSARQGNRNTGELKTSDDKAGVCTLGPSTLHRVTQAGPLGSLLPRIPPETLLLSLRLHGRKETAGGLASTPPGPQFPLREDVPPFSEARALLPRPPATRHTPSPGACGPESSGSESGRGRGLSVTCGGPANERASRR